MKQVFNKSNDKNIAKTLKFFHQNLWKTTVKELIFFKLQARNLQLYRKWDNSQVFFKDFGCTLCWQLYSQPFSRFVKHILWYQNYFGMDYPPFLDPPSIMSYLPINIEIFLTPYYSVFERLHTPPPSICKWGGGG